MDTKCVIVCYDIPESTVRNRLIQLLFASGLSRIQYGVFSGVIPVSRIAHMSRSIEKEFSSKENNILIAPLCSSCGLQALRVNVALPTEARTHWVV